MYQAQSTLNGNQIRVTFVLQYGTGNETAIQETLVCNLVDGNWVVTNPDADPSWNWQGKSGISQLAVMDYLKSRLGLGDL